MMLGDKWLVFFVAIALALGLQLVLAGGQALSFTREIHKLRSLGRTAVGLGGRKWFGRRVFIAMAVDPEGAVVDAIQLRGVTQFARAKPAPRYRGMTVSEIAGKNKFPGCNRAERDAARQAAQTLSTASGMPTAGGAGKGEEHSSV